MYRVKIMFMKELLVQLKACQEARKWAGNKPWHEIFETCHRGDWLLWLFSNTMNYDNEEHFTLLTHAKGHCANTVKHLMKDQRSIDAVDAAINYSGDREVLRQDAYAAAYYAADDAPRAAYVAAYAAVNAYYAARVANAARAAAYVAARAAADAADAAANAAYVAADAARAAANAAFAAAYVAADADADAAADDAAYANQLLTANIVRQYIPIEKWNISLNQEF